MKLRHLSIKNFRGIKTLDWNIAESFVCLLGAGDSTKSTILLAIEYVLYPNFALYIQDADFHNQEVDTPIVITATISDIPDDLTNEKKFGLRLRGWNPIDYTTHDEPFEGDEKALTIQLLVSSTLEPHWSVITERHAEGAAISHIDREKLGASPIGTFLERDLSWSRGSPLLRLTGNLDNADQIMLSARRGLGQSMLANQQTKTWVEQCTSIGEVAKSIGVHPKNNLIPSLDFKSLSNLNSTLTLYDGNIPTRQYGLGSKRLLNMSIQQQSVSNGALILVDEIEHGLEPHRLRHLIRYLRRSLSIVDSTRIGQVIFTTHSSTSIVESKAKELHCVIDNEGEITIVQVGQSIQDKVRRCPEALLGRKIVIGEGKTEFGVIRGLDIAWEADGDTCFGTLGIVPVDGGGYTVAPSIAIEFAKLGYQVAVMVDSDQSISDEHRKGIELHKICLIEWEDKTSIEERFFLDMPWSMVKEELRYIIENHPDTNRLSIIQAIMVQLNITGSPKDWDIDLNLWIDKGKEENDLRIALGKAAHKGSWYKHPNTGIDLSQPLGHKIGLSLHDMKGTDTYNKLLKLKHWLYE